MTPGDKLLARQIAKSTAADGALDTARLHALIAAAYDEADHDRRLTDHSIGLMVDELERLNASLEQTVEERTAELSSVTTRLSATLDAVEQGILMVDADGGIQVSNQRARELLGLSGMSAMDGKQLSALVGSLIRRSEWRGDGDRTAPWLALAKAGEVWEETDYFTAEGRVLAIQVNPAADGGAVLTLLDITERRQQEAALTAAEARYRALFENAEIGIYRSSPDGEQLFANPALARLNGFASVEEMLAKVTDIARNWYVDPNRREEFKRLLERDGHVNDFVSEIYRYKTRERVWVSETAWLVRDENGETLWYEGTVSDASARIEGERRIRHMATHDALTGLANRAWFREELQRHWTTSTPDKILGVLCVDLDRFKELNDTMGHQAGDQALVNVALRLQGIVRDTDLVARLGGDEFAIVLPGVREPADLKRTAGRIVEKLAEPFSLSGQVTVLGATVGIAWRDAETVSPDDLLRNADIALYCAKTAGRGRYSAFEAQMAASLKERRELENDLRQALGRGEISLHYQPVTDTSGQLVSCEALMRWNSPGRGWVSPTQFIPIAEETGLMASLGEWALRAACAEASLWPSNVSVAVNISPLQFRARGLVPAVVNALSASGLDPARLELEITESVLLMDDRLTTTALRALRRIGVRIALDDFGTGHSSLSYLRRCRFDKIKIDQSFVASIERDPVNRAIVRAVIGLGDELGIDVVAEGVETRTQANILRAEGCRLFQGFLYGRPFPAERLPLVRKTPSREPGYLPPLPIRPSRPARRTYAGLDRRAS